VHPVAACSRHTLRLLRVVVPRRRPVRPAMPGQSYGRRGFGCPRCPAFSKAGLKSGEKNYTGNDRSFGKGAFKALRDRSEVRGHCDCGGCGAAGGAVRSFAPLPGERGIGRELSGGSDNRPPRFAFDASDTSSAPRSRTPKVIWM
jgi:hypothetical protein